jgi:sugar/nucleoside kinase (ribokinase family)
VRVASAHDLARILEDDSDDGELGLARRAIGEFGPHVVMLRDSAQAGHGRVSVRVRAVTADRVDTSRPYEAGVVDAFGAGDAALATELVTALDAGARMVKLFPAGPLGRGYLRALLGPFRDTELVPTGGIRHDKVGDWLQAGAAAVGLGSDLVSPEPTLADIDSIHERARTVVAQVAGARASAAYP